MRAACAPAAAFRAAQKNLRRAALCAPSVALRAPRRLVIQTMRPRDPRPPSCPRPEELGSCASTRCLTSAIASCCSIWRRWSPTIAPPPPSCSPISPRSTSGGSTCRRPTPRCTRTVSTSCACRSEEHTSELQSPYDLVCRLLLEKKKKNVIIISIKLILNLSTGLTVPYIILLPLHKPLRFNASDAATSSPIRLSIFLLIVTCLVA